MVLPIQITRAGVPLQAGFAAAFQHDLDPATPSAFLSPPELAYLETLKFPLRRNSFLLGRFAAKLALCEMLSRPDPAAFEIIRGIFDQPLVSNAPAELTLAHSAGAAVAFAGPLGHPAGIDLEWLQEDKGEFLASCFTPQDERFLASIRQPEPAGRYLLWSIKEALSKTLRCGLMTPFPILELSSLSETAPNSWTALFTSFAQYKAHAWLLGRFTLALVLPKNTAVTFNPAPLIHLLRDSS